MPQSPQWRRGWRYLAWYSVVVVLCALFFIAVSGPVTFFPVAALSGIALIVMCLIPLFRTPRGYIGSRYSLAVFPLSILLFAVVATLTGAPARVRWSISKSDFTYEASQLIAQSRSDSPNMINFTPRWIGSYFVDLAVRDGDNLFFYEALGSGLMDQGGFAYLPHGPGGASYDDTSMRGASFSLLGGPWYRWTADF